jgi:hypothetical protein
MIHKKKRPEASFFYESFLIYFLTVAGGTVALAWFIFGLRFGWSLDK